MATRVVKDTYMYEQVGPDMEPVRRQVFAGQFIPDHYFAGEDTASGATETADGPGMVGLGAAPQDYKHNVGVDVEDQVKRRGGKATKARVAAARHGGQAAVDAGNVDNAEVTSRDSTE